MRKKRPSEAMQPPPARKLARKLVGEGAGQIEDQDRTLHDAASLMFLAHGTAVGATSAALTAVAGEALAPANKEQRTQIATTVMRPQPLQVSGGALAYTLPTLPAGMIAIELMKLPMAFSFPAHVQTAHMQTDAPPSASELAVAQPSA